MKYIELLNNILNYASRENLPDVHINSGEIPKIRDKSGDIETLESIEIDGNNVKMPVISLEGVKEIIIDIAGEKGFNKFEEDMELDTSYSYDGSDRYRVNCYIDTDGYSIAMRRIPNEIPTLSELGLGDQIEAMCNKSKGLII